MLNVRVVTCFVNKLFVTGCCYVMLFVVIVVQSISVNFRKKDESDDARWNTISYFGHHITKSPPST